MKFWHMHESDIRNRVDFLDWTICNKIVQELHTFALNNIGADIVSRIVSEFWLYCPWFSVQPRSKCFTGHSHLRYTSINAAPPLTLAWLPMNTLSLTRYAEDLRDWIAPPIAKYSTPIISRFYTSILSIKSWISSRGMTLRSISIEAVRTV